jgi:hypothetical protein
MRALVDPMCGQLEQGADAIIAETTKASVRKAALRWKIDGVPALREALFRPDGFTALGDTWVLCHQMADYFEKGPGKASLEEASPQAVATCRRMEEEITRIAASITMSGDVSRTRAFARKWAAEHPIQHSIAGRESVLSRVLERELAGSFSAGEAVGEMTTALDDLNRKLDVYSAQLFRQARWEAELFRNELREGVSVDKAFTLVERAVRSSEQAVATIEQLAPIAQRAAEVVVEVPKLVASEREAMLKSLDEDFKRSFQFTEERMAAFEQITAERIVALKELREGLKAERLALTQAMEQTSFKVVDYILWRLAQMVLVTLTLLLVAAIVGLHLVRRMFFRTQVNIQSPPSRLEER